MQKLKKVFSPGNDKDDEQMYGASAVKHSAGDADQNIIGASGDKHDEQRLGEPSSAQSQPGHTAADRDAALESRMGDAKEDRSVKREVLNPEKSTRDESGYGATAFKGRDTAADQSDLSSSRPAPLDNQSGLSMKSGVIGSPNQNTEERALYSDGIAGQDTTTDSNLGRNTALAGAGAAAGAGGAYAATRSGQDAQEPTHTDRSFPLRGGAVAGQEDSRPTSSVYSAEGAGPTSSSGATDHSGVTGLYRGTAGGTGADSGKAALTNLGLAQHYDTDHKGHSHAFQGDPCETSPTVEKTLSNIPGPHATVAANMLDPHVPGEFPTEDGIDPHGSHGGAGFGSAAQQPSSRSASGPSVGGFGVQPESSTDDHHHGRNAALASGAGAAGLGAYAATRDRSGQDEPVATQTSSTTAPTTQQRDSSLPIAEQFTSQHGNEGSARAPTTASDPISSSSDKDHHYGRNAGLAAGAGAAGYGAYQYSNRGNDDATSRSNDPYDTYKDAADPRVPPETTSSTGGITSSQGVTPNAASATSTTGPATDPTSSNTTAGPHSSDLANKADPRVESNPYAAQQQPRDQDKDHHYGRNAALAGGAGAAGYGAYQYSKDRGDTDPTSARASEPSSAAYSQAPPGTAVTTGPHGSDTLNKADPRVPSNSQFAQQQQQPLDSDPYASQQQQKLVDDDKNHYGRNAALAGGAGVAGAAGYSALQKDREDTGPASKTIGPHKSNVANIVDPRVQPEPEKMKEHTTSGPWQSDTLNKMDPKVESDPNKADVKAHGYASGVPTQPQQQQQQQQQPLDEDKDHHYGRNAAVAGGAGVAGAAAYGAYDQKEQEKLAKEQAKEQEKLAKEQEKQAQHDAKEQAKEQEKQAKHDAKEADKKAKHDAKEADKQAKHDAQEAEKARKKEEERQAKEQEKLDKQHAKDQEKAEEKRLKEQEKLEKERSKEQEKLEKEKEKENAKLAAARQEEADGKHHNKLHKDPPEEREKKDGILHRIFHHKHHEREGVEGTREGGSFDENERLTGGAGEGALNREGGPESSSSLGNQGLGQSGVSGTDDGIVTNPTTGLPENVGKYGSGAGGTDGSDNITGYHAR